MVTSYIIILALSAWLAAFALLRACVRLFALLQFSASPPSGNIALITTVIFLVVVGAPPAMLVGMVLLGVAYILDQRHYLPPFGRWGVPLVASLLAASTLTPPAVAWLPVPLAHSAMLALLFVLTMAAYRLPSALAPASTGFILALLPLLGAPILFATPSSLALDVALLASALLGVLMAAQAYGQMGAARLPFGLLAGWLMLHTATHGGAIAAAISALVYGGYIAYATAQQRTQEPYAF